MNEQTTNSHLKTNNFQERIPSLPPLLRLQSQEIIRFTVMAANQPESLYHTKPPILIPAIYYPSCSPVVNSIGILILFRRHHRRRGVIIALAPCCCYCCCCCCCCCHCCCLPPVWGSICPRSNKKVSFFFFFSSSFPTFLLRIVSTKLLVSPNKKKTVGYPLSR